MLCKGLVRLLARGLYCRERLPGQLDLGLWSLPGIPKPWQARPGGSSHKASSALPALVPGALLARPVHGFGSVCSLRIELCRPGSPRLLVPVAFGTCHGSGWAQSPRGQPRTSHGAATAGTTRAYFTVTAVAPRAPRSKGATTQHRGLGGGDGLGSQFPDGSN